MYFQYFFGVTAPQDALDYEAKYGVKMPSIPWDLPSGGTNYNFGNEVLKPLWGLVLGGQQVVISPDHEVITTGESETLRPYLENDLKLPKKKDTNVLTSKQNLTNSGVEIFGGEHISFHVSKAGIYQYNIYTLNGQQLYSSKAMNLTDNATVTLAHKRYANQTLVVQLTTPNGVVSKKVRAGL